MCYPKIWQDTAWYNLAIRRKLEFVFRINHIFKNMLRILRVYFYFMNYYNTFQKKEEKYGVTELILF